MHKNCFIVDVFFQQDLRISYNKENYLLALRDNQQEILTKAMAEKSLLNGVNDWLERTPGLETAPEGFNFFKRYQASAEEMLTESERNLQVLFIALVLANNLIAIHS